MARRGMITQSIENLDEKINDLSEQIELIRQFQHSKPYHDKHKSLSGRKQKDYAKNNALVLDEYKSVGNQLKSLYPDGKFSSETSLDRQRQTLYEEREKFYDEYRYLKKSMLIQTWQAEQLTIILTACMMNLNIGEKREN